MKRKDSSRISLVLVVSVAVHMISAEKAIADYVFGKAVNLGPVVNSQYPDGWWGGSISADGLSLYFDSQRPGGLGEDDLWVTTRATVNSTASDTYPSISADGLELYFSSTRPGGLGGGVTGDLWIATRATRSSPWGTPVWLGPILNTQYDEGTPCISADGLSLYFASRRPGGFGVYDLWMTTRPTQQGAWGPPVNLGLPINTAAADYGPSLSADGRVLFFTRQPNPPAPVTDIWMTTRTSAGDNWSAPMLLGPNINSVPGDWNVAISTDSSILYFASDRPGGLGSWDLWQAPITPIVDFNGDGKVAMEDLLRMIESWGQDDPSVDISPTPFGDGKVDTADLEILMSYWGQEVNDPTLLAHWKLDEVEGAVAGDSAATSDGTLIGNPTWQPAGGKHAGALQFDGLGSCVKTPFVCDPSQGTFSVFAWIKGGGPGQVILSQQKGANWLLAGTPDGALTTELKSSGRAGKALKSGVSITDGAWHRVGFVWNGSSRMLYIDDVEVTRDTQTNLTGSSGGLYIGTGSTLVPGSFWSGLIDDVRIYDRAITP